MSSAVQLASLPSDVEGQEPGSKHFRYLESLSESGLVVQLLGADVRLARKDYRQKGQHWKFSAQSGHIESAVEGKILQLSPNGASSGLQTGQIVGGPATGAIGEKWHIEGDGHIKSDFTTEGCDAFLVVRPNAAHDAGVDLCVGQRTEADGQRWAFVDVPEDDAEREKEQAVLEHAATGAASYCPDCGGTGFCDITSSACQTCGATGRASQTQRGELRHPPLGRAESSDSVTSGPSAGGNRPRLSTDTILGVTMEERAERRGSGHRIARQASITRWNDLALSEPLTGHHRDIEEGVGKMPHKVTLKNPDGSVEIVKLTKPGAKMCCGFPDPPGGWYGPFGFLRMVTYLFVLTGCLAVLCLLDSIWNKEGWNIFWCILLALASVLSAIAAWAHEGLAKQVTEIAKQNNRFAANGEKLHEQIVRLQGVEERITSVAGEIGGDVEQLGRTIAGLNKVANLGEMNAMLRSFLAAERNSGQMDLRLDGEEELHDFWSGSKIVLRKELPEFDLDEMHTMSLRTGLTFTCITLIISAVLRNSEGHTHDHVIGGEGAGDSTGHNAATAHLNLVLFVNQPTDDTRLAAFEDSIQDVIAKLPAPYKTTEKMHSVLLDMQSAAAAVSQGPKVVPDSMLAPLAKAMQRIQPWSPHIMSRGSVLAVAAVADLPL